MTSVLELTDWLDKQRRGYHKHDGFPEHPVRVKHHEEYFASHTEEPSADLDTVNIKDIVTDLKQLMVEQYVKEFSPDDSTSDEEYSEIYSSSLKDFTDKLFANEIENFDFLSDLICERNVRVGTNSPNL